MSSFCTTTVKKSSSIVHYDNQTVLLFKERFAYNFQTVQSTRQAEDSKGGATSDGNIKRVVLYTQRSFLSTKFITAVIFGPVESDILCYLIIHRCETLRRAYDGIPHRQHLGNFTSL